MNRSAMSRLKWTTFGIALAVLAFDSLYLGSARLGELVEVYDRGAHPRRLISEMIQRPLESTTHLFVEVRNVSVEVFVVDATDSIEARLEGELPSVGAVSHLTKDVWGSALKFSVREDPKSFWVRHFATGISDTAKLTLALPRRFSGTLSIRSLGGSALLKGVSLSKFEFRSRSGGAYVVESDVHVLHAKTESGTISFDGRSQDVEIESKTGEISTAFRDAPETGRANLRYRSQTGDVSILVHPRASLAVILESLSGRVESSLAFDGKVERTERKIVGAVNEGHGTLDVKSFSGKIRVDGDPRL